MHKQDNRQNMLTSFKRDGRSDSVLNSSDVSPKGHGLSVYVGSSVEVAVFWM